MAQYRLAMAGLATTIAFGLAFSPVGAVAQQTLLKEKLLGSWSLIAVNTLQPNGEKTPLFGPSPKGMAVFDPSGHYSFTLTNSTLPKFASNNRNSGTADENKAVVQGVLTHFGTYTVSEADQTFTLQIDNSSFPNWTGAEQKRGPVTITGDDLKWINPGSSAGGSTENIWKRIK